MNLQRIKTLHDELHSTYPISKETFTIANHQLEIFCIKDMDLLFDELLAKEKSNEEVLDERLPYWAEVWDSALALGEFIDSQNKITSQTIVHEIGCGIGLSGMVAKQKGATVILSDYLQNALKLAELNWLHNDLVPDQIELMDWREPKKELAADIIIASDVLYEKRFFQPIIDCFKCLLKPDGIIYLGEPNRKIATDFFKMLDVQNFQAHHHRFDYRGSSINIYEIRFKR